MDDRAPRTCNAIWAILDVPVERTVIHAAWSGENVALYDLPLIDRPDALPLENHKIRAGAGDILFFYQPPGRLAGLESDRDVLQIKGDILEIVFS